MRACRAVLSPSHIDEPRRWTAIRITLRGTVGSYEGHQSQRVNRKFVYPFGTWNRLMSNGASASVMLLSKEEYIDGRPLTTTDRDEGNGTRYVAGAGVGSAMVVDRSNAWQYGISGVIRLTVGCCGGAWSAYRHAIVSSPAAAAGPVSSFAGSDDTASPGSDCAWSREESATR